MSRRIEFEFLGERLRAIGSGRAGDVLARSLSRRLGVGVSLGLGADRHEFVASYFLDDTFRSEVVRTTSEEAW